MDKKQEFKTAIDLEPILQERFEYHLHKNTISPEQEFLFDVFSEHHISEEEKEQEKKLETLNLLRLERNDKKVVGAGGAPAGMPASTASCPPLTNRGVSMYQNHDSRSDTEPCTLAEIIGFALCDSSQHGGYDGGVMIGFDGHWDHPSFQKLMGNLEEKRQFAESESNCSAEICLNGVPFIVKASGAKDGVYYRYVFEGAGLKFYLHHNPQAKIQPIRLRYGAEALIGRNLFLLHKCILKFLADLRFTVVQEKLSRVDMQVMVDIPMFEIIQLIYGGHAVSKCRKKEMHETGSRFETYTTGSKDSIQLCMYDKRAEMLKMMVSDPVKFSLMMEYCVGDWFCDQERAITRIEFRLGRAALKSFEIDSVEDLYEKEAGLVDWLTSNWFRVLKHPKVRGHENQQEPHEIWNTIRKAFAKHFPGPNRDGKPVFWKQRGSISCNASFLVKQAVGCMATALSLSYGKLASEEQAVKLVAILLEPFKESIFEKANEKTQIIQTLKSVRIAK